MRAFVKPFYVRSNCVEFVCGLEHAFLSKLCVKRCTHFFFFFSFEDHVLHICDHCETNFSPWGVCKYVTYTYL